MFVTSGSLKISSGVSSVSFTIEAINDESTEGSHPCKFTFITSSGDSEYNGISKTYSATIIDNDGAASISTVVSEDSHLREGNLAFRNVYSIIRGPEELTTSMNVRIWTDSQCALKKVDGNYTSQITQPIARYSIPITVVANDDETPEGDHTCHIQHLIFTNDAAYKGTLVSSRYVMVEDNEPAPTGGSQKESKDDDINLLPSAGPLSDETEETASSRPDEPIRIYQEDNNEQVFNDCRWSGNIRHNYRMVEIRIHKRLA